MSSIDTATLKEANQLLSASICAIDGYLIGNLKHTTSDIQEISDLTCHTLLLANLLASHSGCTLKELSEMPLARMPMFIRSLRAVANK